MPERLLRERAVFKVHSDFVSAATRGAIAVIDGNVMAINPGEDPKMQMFIWNNIFFSLGFDVRDHYKVKFIYSNSLYICLQELPIISFSVVNMTEKSRCCQLDLGCFFSSNLVELNC